MKIGVFLHLFYTEMLDEMLDYLSHLSVNKDIEYDLFVTMSDTNEEIVRRIYEFKDNAHIIKVANRGYDVAPFLQALKQVDLKRYSYIIKMHTKRTLSSPAYLPTCCLQKDEWRQKLLEFISSPAHITKTFKCFERDAGVGMITSADLIVRAGKEDRQATTRATQIVRGMGLPLKQQKFVAGTMFIARANLFRLFQLLPYNSQDFEEFDPTHQGGSLAHALERVLGLMIYSQGYKIASYNNSFLWPIIKSTTYKLKNFLFYKRINGKNKLHVKICKIPVYVKQLNK